MLHLLLPGGQLLHAPAVDDVHLGPQPLGAAGGVHSHVAAAHDSDLLGTLNGGVGAGEVGLHQIDAGEELVGGVYAPVVDAGDVHEHGQPRTGADEHGLETLLVHQFVNGDGAAHHGVRGDGDAQGFQAVHLFLDDGLGQTELGNTVHQHAAGQVQRLEHGDLISLPGQVPGAGQSGGAGADNRHTVAVGSRLFRGLLAVGVVPVGHKALQTADAHGVALLTPDAVLFTLALLGTDPAADGGQGAGGGDDLIGGLKVALGHLLDELGNMYHHRAAGHAGLIFAVQAALGLVQGLGFGIPQGNLLKVLVADVGILRGHGVFL